MNVADQARAAIASLKQESTVAVYKAAFDRLIARVGGNTDAGQQVFWWYQGLSPFIATATAINPLTLNKFTVLFDAERAAIAVDSAVQRDMQVSSDSDDEPHVFKRPCLAGNRHQHCKCYNCGGFGGIANACPDQDELQHEATTSDDTDQLDHGGSPVDVDGEQFQ